MVKATNKNKSFSSHPIKVRIVLETTIDAEMFGPRLDDARACGSAEEVMQVLEDYDAGTWQSTFEWNLWDNEDKYTWELEIEDV